MFTLVRSYCALALALLLGAFSVQAVAASDPTANFGLRPAHSDPARPATASYFILDAVAGQTVADEVVVRNSGAAAGTVRLFPVDAVTGQNGGASFPAETDPRREVGSWISVSRTELTLQPGEEQIVGFTVTIPADATPGEHLGGLVALDTAIQKGAPGTLRIDTQHRMVAAVQITLPGEPVERVEVGKISAGGPEGMQLLFIDLNNVGNTMVRPTGTITVTAANGQDVQQVPFKVDTFIPGTTIQFPVAVQRQALGAGEYRARVELTYGKGGSTNYEGQFSITPAQVAQVFPSAVPQLAPPVGATSVPVTQPVVAGSSQWPLFVGGGLLLLLVLVGGIFLGRRSRPASGVK